jgi:ribosomal protein S18 acetylase RimI-like enzyme
MTFRKMEWTDIPSGLSLCRSAGWNQLSRDWEIFLVLDPQGQGVCVNDDGNVVGTFTTIRYEDHFAWIGMVLVDPSQQRKGIGLSLLQEAVQVLKNENCVKLDATPAGRQVYVKLGFQDEYGLSRMLANSIHTEHLVFTPLVTALTSENLESIRSFDRQVFGADRMRLLSWMLDAAPELAFTIHESGKLQGYCLGRHGHKYTHIGPVVANNMDVAKRLVSAALKYCGDKPLILDVSHHNESWRAWLETVGFSELRTFTRMYKGNNEWPGIPENQYAILGPEFG